MALLFTRNFLGLILPQYKHSNLKEKTKIGGIYYFLPDPNGVEAVRNEIKRTRRKGNHARKFNNKTESTPSSNSNSNEKAKKETNRNQNKTPTDPPPSTNAHAEWIMKSAIKSQIACDLAFIY